MKKIGVFIFLLSLIVVSSLVFVHAAENTTSTRAYACLESRVEGKCSSLTFEDQIFASLALGLSECKTSLTSKLKNQECWPSPSCTIKDTALGILAFDRLNQNTDKQEKWILKNNITSNDLEWYLEIDSASATNCTISYDSRNTRIKIGEDKKIASFTDTCLSRANDNNWLKIATSCLKKNFTVSCDKDFISTLLFKKPNSNIWRISPSVQSESAGGKTQHSINFYCFSTSTSCNYEQNLWAALALKSQGNDISGLIPYLVALADDNSKYFPSSFLYYLTNDDEYLQSILASQKPLGYWEFDNKKYYSTALALLSLSEQDESSAKAWLEDVQESNGCWGGISDTGFLLWAGYSRATSGDEPGDTLPDCEVAGGNYCITSGECDEANGVPLPGFSCQGRGGIKVCCDKPAIEETCSDKGGIECLGGKVCSISTTFTSDVSECCLGICEEPLNECEENNGICATDCLSSETQSSYSCDSSSKKCCITKLNNNDNGGGSLWWIWILIILIILVVLGIIFRNHLKVFIFKRKSKFGKEPVTKTHPPYYPPQSPMMRPSPRYLPPRYPQQRKQTSKADSDLDDTFKKLKEMSK